MRDVAMYRLAPPKPPSVVGRSHLMCWTCGLLLVLAWDLVAAEPIIPRGAGQWRYCDAPAAQAEQWQSDRWKTVDFDDATWPEGQALLGYGDPDIRTELSFGGHPGARSLRALFSSPISIRAPAIASACFGDASVVTMAPWCLSTATKCFAATCLREP